MCKKRTLFLGVAVAGLVAAGGYFVYAQRASIHLSRTEPHDAAAAAPRSPIDIVNTNFEAPGHNYEARMSKKLAALLQNSKAVPDRLHTEVLTGHQGGAYLLDAPKVTPNPYGIAPLTAMVSFMTAQPTTVTVTVKGRDGRDLAHTFKQPATEHHVPVIGLYPDFANTVVITSQASDGTKQSKTLTIKTPPLPAGMPAPEVVHAKQSHFHDGFYFICINRTKGLQVEKSYALGFDEFGRVRWWLDTQPASVMFFKEMPSGHIMSLAPNGFTGDHKIATKGVMEYDLMGHLYNYWMLPYRAHHDAAALPGGGLVLPSESSTSLDDTLYEVSAAGHGQITNVWDMKKLLPQHRQPVLDVGAFLPKEDWLHLNAVNYVPQDDSLLITARHQSLVMKFSRRDGQIKWILGNPAGFPPELQAKLLKPIGKGFELPWSPHAAHFTANGDLLVFDNGNFRSFDPQHFTPAYRNYSRAVAYQVDEKNMTVRQVWQYGKERGSELYAPFLGIVQDIPAAGTRVIDFGGIVRDRFGNPLDALGPEVKGQSRIVEVTQDATPKVVYETAFRSRDRTTNKGFNVYRVLVMQPYDSLGH